MGVFKSIGYVVGGIAVGVGAIVALPIAGPVGAITGIGALIAGGTGAVAGGIISSTDDSEEKAKHEGFKEGKQYANSENSVRMNQLLNNLKKQLIIRHLKKYWIQIASISETCMYEKLGKTKFDR